MLNFKRLGTTLIINSRRINCKELTTAGSAPIDEAVRTISTSPPGARESMAVAKFRSVKRLKT